MSKKRIHIDEFFRRGLGNMQMPVAGDDWAVMQAQLAAAQQKRKRRRAFWWWLFGLLLVVGGSLSVYSLVSNKEENNVPLVVNEKEVDNSLPNNTANSSIEKETAAPESSSTTQGDVYKNSNAANADLNDNSNQTTDSRSKSTKGKQTSTPKPATGKGGAQSESQSTVKPAENNSKQENTKNTSEKDTEGTNTDNTLQPNDENTIPPANTTNQQTITTSAIDSVPSENSSEEEEQAKKAKETTSPTDEIVNKFSVARFGLGFAPAVGNWQVQQNTRYGQILKQGGQSAYGVGASFTTDFRLTDKWWIGSGVDVSNISSRGNYNYTHQIYDSIPVLGPGGEIRGYFYTNFRDTAHNYNLQSTYTFITIPVQAWYNIPLNQKTGIMLGSNVQFHYLAMAKGEYINPNTLFSQKATVNNDQLRKINFSVAIQMGYYYSINDKWRFEGVLQMQQMGKSMFSNSVGADVRLQRIGLNVGIVYNLMRKKGE